MSIKIFSFCLINLEYNADLNKQNVARMRRNQNLRRNENMKRSVKIINNTYILYFIKY